LLKLGQGKKQLCFHYLVVNDGSHSSIGNADGGDLGDELAHAQTTLQLAISSEGPHQGIDEVARNILLYLVKLTKERPWKYFTRESL